MTTLTWENPIIKVEDGYVIVGGSFPTGDGKGTHSALQPRVLLAELQTDSKPAVGDLIRFDGSRFSLVKK